MPLPCWTPAPSLRAPPPRRPLRADARTSRAAVVGRLELHAWLPGAALLGLSRVAAAGAASGARGGGGRAGAAGAAGGDRRAAPGRRRGRALPDARLPDRRAGGPRPLPPGVRGVPGGALPARLPPL